MKGRIFELLRVSLEREGLSEARRRALYERILVRIELRELSHAEQMTSRLEGGELVFQGRASIWSWDRAFESRAPDPRPPALSGCQLELYGSGQTLSPAM